MSSRGFRLATVLRVRRIQEEQARGGVARARMEVRQAEADAASAEQRAVGDGPPAAADPVAYLAAVSHRLALAADAATARAAVTEKEAVAEERHEEWKAAAQKVKPLERLEETHRDAVRAADARAAQAANDEIAGARHEVRRRVSASGKAASGGGQNDRSPLHDLPPTQPAS